MTYLELQRSLRVFGLGDRATLADIRRRYRELVRKCHPDSGSGEDGDRIRMVNEAHRILQAYIQSYRYSFSEDEFYEQNPEERIRRQFMDDPLWGKGD